ncbi:Type I restriction modification DNA specificity domain protein [Candidatus Venteria ishoeyi]|uniref:Type I restriction modification DNA specificity domain protein n=1 Tax=Candidatus Venteria ishoeyi TaxID=1899563 RepID=A0A1H6F8D2_9GAMM|nr:Type I restriction modification DNA specificity domain protein [Candidatus Venteria ishoeyi]
MTYEEWFLRFRIDGVKLDIDSETGFPYGWGIEKFKTQLNFKTGKLDSNAVVPDGIYDFYTCAKEIFKTNTTCFNGEAVLLGGNNATGDFSLFYANSKFDAYQRTYIVTSDNLPLVYVFFVLKNYLPYFKNISSGAATKFLTMRILDQINILIPKSEVIVMFQKQIKPMFDSVINLKNQNQRLKEARDILLPRLMTGIIDTENMDIKL